MYCPECQVEYRPGFTTCADCHVPLVETPPQPDPAPTPELVLVTVLEGNNPIAAAVAKTCLEQAAIPFFVEGEELSPTMQYVDPMFHRWWKVQVAQDCEAEARALLEEAVGREDLVLNVDTERPQSEELEWTEGPAK